MVATHPSKSARVRALLDHPIIDADGHYIEIIPVFQDYLRDVGGTRILEEYERVGRATIGDAERWGRMTSAERRDVWKVCPTWWGAPARNTLDRATASLPRLFAERMDELGLDFSVLYPSSGLGLPNAPQAELRQIGCRAFNLYVRDLYQEFADRVTPAAIIPMHTPQEAVEALDHAVKELGLKAVLIAGHVKRPIPAIQRQHPDMSQEAFRLDTFGIDSEYDYDPVWAKCVELQVAPTAHQNTIGVGYRRSPENHVYNHIGHFAVGGEALCKSLFMGGVTRRFPSLKVGFLEGGVGWACALYADMIAHWEKRNPRALEDLDPKSLDRDLFIRLVAEYGDERVRSKGTDIHPNLRREQPRPPVLDDWAPCHIQRAEEIRDLFVPNFYFGCEADDPINAWAFNARVNPFGARLHAMFGSDVSHWDVPEMSEVVEEAHEMVERGLFTETDFKDFTFTNVVTFLAGTNPDFFRGTRVEGAVAKALAADGR